MISKKIALTILGVGLFNCIDSLGASYWGSSNFERINEEGVKEEVRAKVRNLFDFHNASGAAKNRANEFLHNAIYIYFSSEELSVMSHQEKKALERYDITRKACEFIGNKARLIAIEILKQRHGLSEQNAVSAVTGLEKAFIAQSLMNYEQKGNLREINGQLEQKVEKFIKDRLY